MKDQLLYLLQLQTIDAKVKELEAQIKTLPEKTEAARRDLAKLEAMVGVERARLTETETWKRQQETLLEREHDSLKQAKTKLNASRNGKEFEAANREIEAKKRSIIDRDKEVKKVVEALGQTTAQVVAHEADVENVRQTLATEQATVDAKIAALRAEIETVGAGRAELRAKLEAGLLKTYDTLAQKKGYAVAPVEKGVCRGCHTAVPPQLNNILARGESVEVCPRCGRMIYRQELLADKPAPAGDAAPAASSGDAVS